MNGNTIGPVKGALTATVCLTLMTSGWTSAATTAAGTPSWPADTNQLVFLWKNGDRVRSPSVAYDKTGTPLISYGPVARGNAIYGRHYEMLLRGGSFHANRLGDYLSAAVAKEKALSFEAFIVPPRKAPAAQGRIVSYTTASGETLFGLVQRDDKILLALKDTAAQADWKPLMTLADTRPFHLAIRCASGEVIAWRDGKEAGRIQIEADFAGWKPGELVFGDSFAGGENWPGRLEGILLYSRGQSASEVQQDAIAYAALTSVRQPVPQVRFTGTLLRRSDSETAIDPYFRALALFEYKVDKVLAGTFTGEKILVYTWTVMHKKLLPDAERPVGKPYEVVVEPFESQPQLECELQFDTFDRDFSLPVFYDVGAE